MAKKHEGYHNWPSELDELPYGSFEVFQAVPMQANDDLIPGKWYWWACFPGCLPDGDACGPFDDATDAWLDAVN